LTKRREALDALVVGNHPFEVLSVEAVVLNESGAVDVATII